MRRIILGIIAGFVIWSVAWLTGILIAWMLWDSLVHYFSDLALLTPLLITAGASVIAGFSAALIARENTKTPLILSGVVLVVVVAVQLYVWDRIELWFHLAWWASLIPMIILGGKLKRVLV